MWTRELLGRQPLEVAFDRHRDSTCVVFFFWSLQNFGYSSIFRKFNFRHRVALRKLNLNENNWLYGILTSVVWIPTMLALVAHLAYRSYRQDSRPFAKKASKCMFFFRKTDLRQCQLLLKDRSGSLGRGTFLANSI